MIAGPKLLRTGLAADAVSIAELHAASWRSAYRPYLSATYLDADIGAERERVWQEHLAQPNERQREC
jgi:hypothetical protein